MPFTSSAKMRSSSRKDGDGKERWSIFSTCAESTVWDSGYAIEEAYQNDQVLLRKKHSEYLKVMEATAAYNLRNSFTVVGLLQETQEFYNMVTQRVEYIDMSLNPTTEGRRHGSGGSAINVRCDAFLVTQQVEYMDMSLNPTTEGKSHGSGGSAINARCDAFFQDPALQKRGMAKGPELATLVRLYEVGV